MVIRLEWYGEIWIVKREVYVRRLSKELYNVIRYRKKLKIWIVIWVKLQKNWQRTMRRLKHMEYIPSSIFEIGRWNPGGRSFMVMDWKWMVFLPVAPWLIYNNNLMACQEWLLSRCRVFILDVPERSTNLQ